MADLAVPVDRPDTYQERLYAWLIDAGHLTEYGREWLRKPPTPDEPRSLYDVLGLTDQQRREAEVELRAAFEAISENERQAAIKTRDIRL